MKFLLLSIFIVVSLTHLNAQNGLTSIYQFELPGLNGGDKIKLSDFKGKKILIVNIASQSDSIKQYKQLLQIFSKDSMENFVLIFCPSNSFGKEPGTIQGLRKKFKPIGNENIKISAPIIVTGEQAHPLFKWFTSAKQNGTMNAEVYDDFNKFLINEQGVFVAFFGKTQSPEGAWMKKVIKSK